VFDRVRMIQSCRLKKLLDIIRRQPCLMLKIVLGGSHKLLLRVARVLVIIIFIAIGGDRDLLEQSPWPLLIDVYAPLCPPLIGYG
jgi:hypothetical protein